MSVLQPLTTSYSVNANQYDQVLAFFSNVTTTELAKKYTGFVLNVASQSGISVSKLMDDMVNTDGTINMSSELAYYLNTIGNTKTKMYGIYSPLDPVLSAYRNVMP